MIPDAVFTLVAAKAHLRVYHAEEDALITSMMDAAVHRCEQYTGRAWTERTDVAARIPTDQFFTLLPISVVKATTMVVSYLRADDTLQPYPVGTWVVRSNYQGGQLVMLREIPADIHPDASENARIKYTAEPEFPPPASIVQAAMLYLGDLYANREAQFVGTITTPNRAADSLLDPLRITWGV